jgi:L-amino acid ligase
MINKDDRMKTEQNSRGNLLIVDGALSGRIFPYKAAALGWTVYHLSSRGLGAYLTKEIEGPYAGRFTEPENPEDILPELKKYDFKAAMPGTESGVLPSEWYADALGLPVNDMAFSRARRDKMLMQQALKDAGVRHIPYILTNDVEEAAAWFAQMGGWVVVKPRMSAATEGVSICRTEERLREAFLSVLGSISYFGDRNEQILCEKYIEGRELVVNHVTHNGVHCLAELFMYNKLELNNSAPVYDCVWMVTNITEEIREAVAYTEQALDALGIRYGASHSEVMLSSDGPYLVETNSRMMGHVPTIPSMCKAIGHDPAVWIIDSYTDKEAFDRHQEEGYHPNGHALWKMFFSEKECRLVDIPALQVLKFLPSVREVDFESLRETMFLPKTVDMFTMSGECYLYDESYREILYDYTTISFIERFYPRLFYRAEGDGELSAPERKLIDKLEGGEPLEDEYRAVFHGFVLPHRESAQQEDCLGRFETVTAESPDALAVLHEDAAGVHTLSAGELRGKARALAAALKEMGFGPGKTLAIGLERDEWLPVAMLSALYSGGAFVLVEPGQPDESIRFTLEDCGAGYCVTRSGPREHYALPGVKTIAVDELRPLYGGGIFEAPRLSDPAMYLYRSGPTGTPTGILKTYRSLLDMMARHHGDSPAGIPRGDRVCVTPGIPTASYIVTALAAIHNGACICTMDERIKERDGRLARFVEQNKASVLFCSPPLVDYFAGNNACAGLRLIFTAGGRLTLKKLPPCPLVNVYTTPETGPVCCSVVERPESASTFTTPLPGQNLYILDEDGRLCKENETGEICVSGAGIDGAYLHSPELNNKKFIRNPYYTTFGGDRAHIRLYRTGDAGRYNPDGGIDFLGRVLAEKK